MKLQAEGKLELSFESVEKKVLFHAHCHQRSLAGTASSLNALRLAPGYQVELVNAGAAVWQAPSATKRSITSCP